MPRFFSFFCLLVMFSGCSLSPGPQNTQTKNITLYEELSQDPSLAKATFAGGCFWCMEGPFETQEGVKEAFAGYAGGSEETATYKQVSRGDTAHREAVQIFYDPQVISYPELLEIFWKQIDPLDAGGQFADRGFHYTTAIYFHSSEQETEAKNSKNMLQENEYFDRPIATQIIVFETFFPAEEYHQDYYLHSAQRYNQYKEGSGRGSFILENANVIKDIFNSEK